MICLSFVDKHIYIYQYNGGQKSLQVITKWSTYSLQLGFLL